MRLVGHRVMRQWVRCFTSSAAQTAATSLPVTPLVLEPGQIADWIIEQIEHTHMNRQDGKCEAASYDISGNCWRYFSALDEKFSKKEKLVRLLDDNVEYLHVDDLGLTDFDALILSRMLRFRSSSVRLFDLNNNPLIGDIGMNHVCTNVLAPASPVKLRSLFVSGCGITDVGVGNLVGPLCLPQQSLHILELRKNQITDDGAEALAEVLSVPAPHGPEFSLFLSGNSGIGERGAVALAKAVIESNGRLKVWLKDTCPNMSADDKAEIMKFTKNHLKF